MCAVCTRCIELYIILVCLLENIPQREHTKRIQIIIILIAFRMQAGTKYGISEELQAENMERKTDGKYKKLGLMENTKKY